MCGIAGLINYSDKDISIKYIEEMSKEINHRGPDDQGYLTYDLNNKFHVTKQLSNCSNSKVFLAHRRLSILDLSEAGWQPMVIDNGKLSIVFNGEIYNFIELRQKLIQIGVEFKSNSDTEVLLYAYKHWGKQCLSMLEGMFGFVILDRYKNTLFCARDFFGIKPFYYSDCGEFFSFSSEIKSLLKAPNVSRKANLSMIYDYLASSMQEGTKRSFFDDIKQLPPAHYLEIDLSKQRKPIATRYWSIDNNNRYTGSYSNAQQDLREIFQQSVDKHLRSDVTVGANLSGGIDSSSIVMMARQVRGNDFDLHTISYIADDDAVSEEKWVDIINKESQAIPHKVNPTAKDMTSELDELIRTQDEPVGSSSVFAQYRVFKAINELGIKVVLDGQGADELLAGYRSYIIARLASMLRQWQLFSALRFSMNACRLPGMAGLVRTWATSKGLAQISKLTRINQKSVVTSGPDWVSSNWFNKQGVEATPSWFSTSKNIMMEQLQYTFEEASLPHLLRVADRNSMAFSVESRLPFLTPTMANFIFSLPEKYIVNQRAYTKSVFRDSMKPLVSSEILKRKDKIGFTTPEEKWLKEYHGWVESIISSEVANSMPVINSKAMMDEWVQFKQGKVGFDWRFWRWINLIRWTSFYNITY